MRKLAFATVPFVFLLLAQPTAPVSGYKVIHTFPHDPDAFTQGLLYYDGFLYEGTGMNGHSSVRKVELSTGNVLQKVDLPYAYFGEGITLWKDKLIELTWQSKIGFIYDRATLKQIGSFTYNRDGWGLTHDDKRLIMSDGSSTLYFWDPETFKETGHLDIDDKGRPVPDLNELEYIHGEIYANVWHLDRIARISPANGHVVGWINLTGLWNGSDNAQKTLNGIAYDARQNRLLVTGKLWPKLFEIRIQ
jgi:glutamine cyclotransferase